MAQSRALFGSSSNRNQSKNLVEFRAGKMTLKGKMVHPDTRKGLLYVHQSEDSLMHLCWKDRAKGTVEDDLIIFPDDCEFVHVKQCTTGRVYLLRFQSTGRKFFFWMQEPKSDKDADLCSKVNEYLNNPPTPGSNRTGGSGILPQELTSGLSEGDLQSLLGSMNQNQLMQLLGMGGGMPPMLNTAGRSTSAQSETRASSSPAVRASSGSPSTTASKSTTSATTTSTTSGATDTTSTTSSSGTTATSASATGARPASGGANIQLSDLQTILTGLLGPDGAEGAAAPKPAVDLSKAFNTDVIIPILANSDVQERLVPFLPEGEELPKTEQHLRETVQSPQFLQALSSFSAALSSGQLGPLMGQFGLNDDAKKAAEKGDVEAFAKAIEGDGKTDDKKAEPSQTDDKKAEKTADDKME